MNDEAETYRVSDSSGVFIRSTRPGDDGDGEHKEGSRLVETNRW